MTGQNKIRRLYEKGKPYADWYDQTYANMTPLFGQDTRVFLGFLAATSMNSSVMGNVTLALKAYGQYKTGQPFDGYLPAVITNLERVASGNWNLKGNKIHNFAQALIGNTQAVVVDRWMLRAYESDERDRVRGRVRSDAESLSVAPARFQAAVWSAVRPGDPHRMDRAVKQKLHLHQTKLPLR